MKKCLIFQSFNLICDRNGHTFKRNAVYLKKARGMMLNYLIEHHIEDIKQIKEIVIDDYHFSENDFK